METKPRTPVLWLHGLECTCCSESFIRSAHPLVSDVVLSMISLDYDDTIMASAGHQAEAILEEVRHKYKGNYILAVEGNPPLNQDGMSCIIGGRPFVEQLKEVAADCKAIISWGSCASWGCVQGAINMERLNLVSSIIDRTIEFIDKVYIPDLLAIASFYKDWTYGGGLSGQAVLSYGDIPDRPNDDSAENQMLPRGAIVNGNLAEIHDVDLRDPEQIQEYVDHSWFSYADESMGLHPWDGVTEPNYELGPNTVGTRTNIQAIDEGAKYSWIKAPRWRGHAMEVAPWRATSSVTPRVSRSSRNRWRRCSPTWVCRSQPSFPPWDAPRPVGWRPPGRPTRCATSKTSSWRGSRPETWRPPTWTSGNPTPGPRKPRASAPPRPRGAPWDTGFVSRTQDRQLTGGGAHDLEQLAPGPGG